MSKIVYLNIKSNVIYVGTKIMNMFEKVFSVSICEDKIVLSISGAPSAYCCLHYIDTNISSPVSLSLSEKSLIYNPKKDSSVTISFLPNDEIEMITKWEEGLVRDKFDNKTSKQQTFIPNLEMLLLITQAESKMFNTWLDRIKKCGSVYIWFSINKDGIQFFTDSPSNNNSNYAFSTIHEDRLEQFYHKKYRVRDINIRKIRGLGSICCKEGKKSFKIFEYYSIYLDVDANNEIRNIVFSDSGMFDDVRAGVFIPIEYDNTDPYEIDEIEESKFSEKTSVYSVSETDLDETIDTEKLGIRIDEIKLDNPSDEEEEITGALEHAEHGIQHSISCE